MQPAQSIQAMCGSKSGPRDRTGMTWIPCLNGVLLVHRGNSDGHTEPIPKTRSDRLKMPAVDYRV